MNLGVEELEGGLALRLRGVYLEDADNACHSLRHFEVERKQSAKPNSSR